MIPGKVMQFQERYYNSRTVTMILDRVLQNLNHYYGSLLGITTLEPVLQLQERSSVIIALSAGTTRQCSDNHRAAPCYSIGHKGITRQSWYPDPWQYGKVGEVLVPD